MVVAIVLCEYQTFMRDRNKEICCVCVSEGDGENSYELIEQKN